MPRRPPATRRWLTALSWPGGVSLTSWDYMWRTTVLHRREVLVRPSDRHLPAPYPEGVDDPALRAAKTGHGPLFPRRYRTRIRESAHDAPSLVRELTSD